MRVQTNTDSLCPFLSSSRPFVPTPSSSSSPPLHQPDQNLFDLSQSPEEVAAQLKVIEFERLSAIGPEEFVQTFVRGDQKEDYSDMREAHNVETYVEWFNRLRCCAKEADANRRREREGACVCAYAFPPSHRIDGGGLALHVGALVCTPFQNKMAPIPGHTPCGRATTRRPT